MQVGVVDYGMGNLLSVYNALYTLGADVQYCQTPEQINAAERLVLPGVGAFRDCIQQLHQRGLVEALTQAVKVAGKPILGICLGMQVMAQRSHEGGMYEGLGWFKAEVKRLKPGPEQLRIPHIGWNNIEQRQSHPVLAGLPASPDFYFVHSYALVCEDASELIATCDYGQAVTAMVARDNMVATQFHPEKSQDYGLRMLENFLDWSPT